MNDQMNGWMSAPAYALAPSMLYSCHLTVGACSLPSGAGRAGWGKIHALESRPPTKASKGDAGKTPQLLHWLDGTTSKHVLHSLLQVPSENEPWWPFAVTCFLHILSWLCPPPYLTSYPSSFFPGALSSQAT